jgi:hypothetical protein
MGSGKYDTSANVAITQKAMTEETGTQRRVGDIE